MLELLALCVGQTVHAVRSRNEPRFLAADQLAEAIKLDMGGLVESNRRKLPRPHQERPNPWSDH